MLYLIWMRVIGKKTIGTIFSKEIFRDPIDFLVKTSFYAIVWYFGMSVIESVYTDRGFPFTELRTIVVNVFLFLLLAYILRD